MAYTPEIHHRKSYRLKNYDYSQNGLYFVTILSYQRQYLFGEIYDKTLKPTDLAIMAAYFWQKIPEHYPSVVLHEYVIMPNHIHGILEITSPTVTNFESPSTVRAQNFEPLRPATKPKHEFQKIIPRSLGAIIRGYKTGVTKWARQNTNTYQVWHRNYHDHIIRNERSYYKIAEYIRNNPLLWHKDRYGQTDSK